MPRVAVIGQGVVGATVAFRLAEQGFEVFAFSSTERNTASHAAHGVLLARGHIKPRDPLFAFKLRAMSLFPSLLQELEQKSGMTIKCHWEGVWEPFFSQEEYRAQAARYFKRSFRGALKLEHSEATKVDEQLTALNPSKGGFYYPQTGWFDPQGFLQSLLEAGKKCGVRSFSQVVSRVLETERCVCVYTEGGQKISCDHVVVAAGADGKKLLESCGYPSEDVCYYFGQTHHCQWLAPPPSGVWVLGNMNVASIGSQIILGSTSKKIKRQEHTPKDHPFDLSLLSGFAQSLKDRNSFVFRHSFSGVRVLTRTRSPELYLIGKTKAHRVLCLTGFYKSGYLLAEEWASRVVEKLGHSMQKRASAVLG